MNVQPASAAVAQTVAASPPRPETASAPRETKRNEQPESPQQATSQTEREISRTDVAEAAKRVEQFVDSFASQLQFSVDETSGTRVVKVIDRNTSELIRQIPSEEMLQIAKALDRLQGLLVRQQA